MPYIIESDDLEDQMLADYVQFLADNETEPEIEEAFEQFMAEKDNPPNSQ